MCSLVPFIWGRAPTLIGKNDVESHFFDPLNYLILPALIDCRQWRKYFEELFDLLSFLFSLLFGLLTLHQYDRINNFQKQLFECLDIMNRLTFLNLFLLHGQKMLIIRGLSLILGNKFLHLILINILDLEQIVLLLFRFLQLLLESFYLVDQYVVLL